MYLHLGNDYVVRKAAILAVFDLDNSSQSHLTREFLLKAEKAGRVMTAALPVFLTLLCVLAACLILDVKPPKGKGGTGGGKASPASGKLKHETWIRIAVFAAAALLIIAGIANGSVQDVLAKAISICTECVGLG